MVVSSSAGVEAKVVLMLPSVSTVSVVTVLLWSFVDKSAIGDEGFSVDTSVAVTGNSVVLFMTAPTAVAVLSSGDDVIITAGKSDASLDGCSAILSLLIDEAFNASSTMFAVVVVSTGGTGVEVVDVLIDAASIVPLVVPFKCSSSSLSTVVSRVVLEVKVEGDEVVVNCVTVTEGDVEDVEMLLATVTEAAVLVTVEWFAKKAVVSRGISVLFTVTKNSSEYEGRIGNKKTLLLALISSIS